MNDSRIPFSLVAFLDGEIAGTISVVENDLKERDCYTPWVASNYVVEKHRNKGISSKMMVYVEEAMRRIGIKTAYLATEEVPDFYRKRGWQEIEKVNYKSEESLIFKKDLT